jgi:hypothetical protein
MNFTGQPGFRTQGQSNGQRGGGSDFRIVHAQGDHQVARTGEVLLPEFERAHFRQMRGQQMQHLGVKPQARKPDHERHAQEHPEPVAGLHGSQ